MLWQRVVSALLGVPIVLGAIYYGSWPFFAMVVLVGLWGWNELANMISQHGAEVNRPLGALALAGLLIVAWVLPTAWVGVLTLVLLAIVGSQLWSYDSDLSWAKAANTALTLFYLALPFTHFLWLRALDNGWQWMLLLLLCTWAYDTFAYFAGLGFGRRRPWPAISPKKSLEGVFGGVGGSILLALLLFRILPALSPAGENWIIHSLVFGLGVALAAQTGDLTESAIKRHFHVKDSGHFLPGHGGLLDRVDSIIFATPFVYYYLTMIIL